MTLDGLMSRWMIPFWWACWIAWQTGTNSSSRSRGVRWLSSQYLVIGTPWTSSMTKYGRPASVAPPSKTRAMLTWSIIARACRSASKRAMTWRLSMPGLMTLRATLRCTGCGLLGHVDGAHAAFADLLQQLVRADAACRGVPRAAGRWSRRSRRRAGSQEAAGLRRATAAGPRRAPAMPASSPQACVEVGRPLRGDVDVQGGVKDVSIRPSHAITSLIGSHQSVRSLPAESRHESDLQKARSLVWPSVEFLHAARPGRRPSGGRRCAAKCPAPRPPRRSVSPAK